MRTKWIMISGIIAVVIASCEDDRTELQVKSDNNLQTELDRTVDAQMRAYFESERPHRAMVGITKQGVTTFYAYSRESELLPSEENIFEIGSITKTFTGLLVAREVKAGNIQLDAPVTDYLDPEDDITLVRNGKVVTVRHLLTHTSGLPENPPSIEKGLASGTLDPDNPAKDYDHADLIADIKTFKFVSDPGKRYAYSNFGYAILGEVLQVVTGKDFEENITEVSDALGLLDTRVDLTTEQKSRLVTGHDQSSDREMPPWEMGEAAAVGALHATCSDMMQYLNAYINATPDSWPFHDAHASLYAIDNSQQIGYAWNRIRLQESFIVWHNGETNGQRSFIAFVEGTQTGVVILTDRAIGNSDKLDVAGLTLLIEAEE